jgi:hypothetical protein
MTEPVAYMERTRRWYAALGYETPYVWAHNTHIPFSPLAGPLAQSRIALVTTAALYQPGKGDQGPGAAYNGAAKFFSVWREPVEPGPDVRISHIAYDRKHTHAKDPNSWFPLPALKRAVAAGRIGGLTAHVFGFPTNRSQRTSVEQNAPALLDAVREDAADAVILVANCPVCHQSLTLAARHLEDAGMPTVVMGCAKDIVEHCGCPRFVFSDFPLGNAAGRPFDETSHDQTLELALSALETLKVPGTTIVSPLKWAVADESWKKDYCNPDCVPPEELARRRAEFDAAKTQAARARVTE